MNNETRIIVVYVHKGGCGKTLTAVNLLAGKVNLEIQAKIKQQKELKKRLGKNDLVTEGDYQDAMYPHYLAFVDYDKQCDGLSFLFGKKWDGKSIYDYNKNWVTVTGVSHYLHKDLVGSGYPSYKNPYEELIIVDCPPNLELLGEPVVEYMTDYVIPISDEGSAAGLTVASKLIEKAINLKRVYILFNNILKKQVFSKNFYDYIYSFLGKNKTKIMIPQKKKIEVKEKGLEELKAFHIVRQSPVIKNLQNTLYLSIYDIDGVACAEIKAFREFISFVLEGEKNV